MEYLALSHPWGPEKSSHFCTYPKNLAQHKEGINFDDLSLTFQDAVVVARGLNQRYLWIDSICIIQGPDGDFDKEAERMEDVFSQAYCVLAASCATGQHDGFLEPRQERKYLTIRQGLRAPVYVCEFIDNFQQHVLGSPLNKRGWVLQERALARRTIYFTDRQTYWECGSGVSCETGMKMNNAPAAFLGDSRFAESTTELTRCAKIRRYQDLYSRYSRLELSHDQDRPVAIAGIEKRLVSSFRVRGGFGVLDDGERGLLWRSLLWKRNEKEAPSLQRIDFEHVEGSAAARSPLPSWSWMAYRGAIDYLDPPFDKTAWEAQDIHSQWSNSVGKTWSYSRNYSACPLELIITPRPVDVHGAKASKNANIILDDPERVDELERSLKCVILGRVKDPPQELMNERVHFVLLVTSTAPVSFNIYNRVGVGFMPGTLIDFSEQTRQGILR